MAHLVAMFLRAPAQAVGTKSREPPCTLYSASIFEKTKTISSTALVVSARTVDESATKTAVAEVLVTSWHLVR